MTALIEKRESSQDKPPILVSLLGYGGLIPFVVTALGQGFGFLSESIHWPFLALAYGAVILSFVGALHWGFAMTMESLGETRQQQAYLWSVIPALLGFLALAVPVPIGYAVLVTGFALAYLQDLSLARSVKLPGWYLGLRLRLSSVACATLILGMAFVSA